MYAPQGQNHIQKFTYRNYPVNQIFMVLSSIATIRPLKFRGFMTNRFPTKPLQIMNLAAILDLKIFTNIINECLDYQYFIGYFQNAFVSTLFKII